MSEEEIKKELAREIIAKQQWYEAYQKEKEARKLILFAVENNYISKDKIKAKIEEIQNRRIKDGECELALHGFQREAKIQVLQELLEEEE